MGDEVLSRDKGVLPGRNGGEEVDREADLSQALDAGIRASRLLARPPHALLTGRRDNGGSVLLVLGLHLAVCLRNIFQLTPTTGCFQSVPTCR